MQRLYSTFPGSWPGLALLVLRCVAAAELLTCARTAGWFSLALPWLLLAAITLGISVLLITGLWTPVAGVAQFILELAGLISSVGVDLDSALWGTVGLCVAMLGPGAASLDSHLFGRKRIEVPAAPD